MLTRGGAATENLPHPPPIEPRALRKSAPVLLFGHSSPCWPVREPKLGLRCSRRRWRLGQDQGPNSRRTARRQLAEIFLAGGSESRKVSGRWCRRSAPGSSPVARTSTRMQRPAGQPDRRSSTGLLPQTVARHRCWDQRNLKKLFETTSPLADSNEQKEGDSSQMACTSTPYSITEVNTRSDAARSVNIRVPLAGLLAYIHAPVLYQHRRDNQAALGVFPDATNRRIPTDHLTGTSADPRAAPQLQARQCNI